MWKTIFSNLFNLLFPKRCINCQKEGAYLCNDCLSLIEISPKDYCPFCCSPKETENGKTCKLHHSKNLNGLIAATSYQDKIVKNAINTLKYKPFIKDLAKPLSSLIIAHFKLLDNCPDFSNSILCAVPLHKTRLRQRGFNQAEEIAKHLSKSLNIPFRPRLLLKTKKTLPQMTLNRNGRIKNVSGAFEVNPQKKNQIFGKKILLVDDVFTTGSTMEEGARVLRETGAKEVWGIVAARG